MPDYNDINPWLTEDETINVVIETPKGSRNKYTYNEDTGVFILKKTLPEGMVFPYNFEFIPQTFGPDGDLIDNFIKELENFFITYNEMSGKTFIPKGNQSAQKAIKYIKKMNKAYKKKKKR